MHDSRDALNNRRVLNYIQITRRSRWLGLISLLNRSREHNIVQYRTE